MAFWDWNTIQINPTNVLFDYYDEIPFQTWYDSQTVHAFRESARQLSTSTTPTKTLFDRELMLDAFRESARQESVMRSRNSWKWPRTTTPNKFSIKYNTAALPSGNVAHLTIPLRVVKDTYMDVVNLKMDAFHESARRLLNSWK